ncbi:MAG: carbohydrate-binding domain-containing protein [Christensenellaceae bacterium]|jgi:hypothetical protein|nr:carbohydrate-binding domain-containing protein [Christensenellaceae bacterium]
MKHYSRFLSLLLAAAISLSALTGCGAATGAQEVPAATAQPVQESDAPAEVTLPSTAAAVDLNAAWDSETATKITLEGASITIDGPGAKTDQNVVAIAAPGTYVVSGSLPDGQLAIAAKKTDVIHLVLCGVEITNKSGAAIYASKCGKLVITLAEGTQNTLTDGGSAFAYANVSEEEPNAALFCKDDLTINGAGSLAVHAGFHNGIGTKDNLIIAGGVFDIDAANHGLRGNDSVTILGGDFTIRAGNDGIQTNNGEDAAKGSILIEGGRLAITAAHDGIQSENGLFILGGAFNITAGGGAAAAPPTSADAQPGGYRGFTPPTSDDAAPAAAADAETGSYKGLKAVNAIEISAGTFDIDSADDAVHANGDIAIRGGEFTLASGDDGMHADGTLTISGGSVNVLQSYEGLESANIDISAGTIVVMASDDGINAAGGADANIGGGRFGADSFAAGAPYGIVLTGGEITIYSGSDGIDSNGTLEVSGGTIAVFVNALRDGDATDVDSGGSIPPALYGSYAVKAGVNIAVDDLWSITPAADATAFCLMIPGIVNGQSYQITADGAPLATVAATTTIQGMMMGGGNAGGWGGGQAPEAGFGGERPPSDGARPGRGKAPAQP